MRIGINNLRATVSLQSVRNAVRQVLSMLNPGGVQVARRGTEGWNNPGLAAKKTFAACAYALGASVRQRTH